MPLRRDTPLWTCPKCGAQLVTRNMWHACGPYTVDSFLADKGPRGRELFARFVELVESCGPVIPAPARTRVAFMVRVRFAGVDQLTERSMAAHFGLPYALPAHPRVRKIDYYPPSWYVHTLRVTSVDELDDELRGWLCESYRLMGEQRRFDQSR
jgi:hypothetical protein